MKIDLKRYLFGIKEDGKKMSEANLCNKLIGMVSINQLLDLKLIGIVSINQLLHYQLIGLLSINQLLHY